MYHLTEENVKTHFLTNPEWKRVFLKNYPDWTPEKYIEQATELFVRNGYRIVENERMKSKKFAGIVRLDLYGPSSPENSDGFVFGLDWRQESSAYKNIIIEAICDYLVDFTNWK